MTIIIHYSRLCQFLTENKIISDKTTLIPQDELVPLCTACDSQKITYFDLQLFVKTVKKQETWFYFVLRMVSFGYLASYTLCKSIRLLKQWETGNSYLWDGSKRLIEIFSLELYVKERKRHGLEEENVQLQAKLSEVRRLQSTVFAELKEQCHRWDIVLSDNNSISVLSKQNVEERIKRKLSTDLNIRLELIANSVFKSQLSCCLSYADKFMEETNRNNNNSSSSSYSHIRKWLLPLQSQLIDPSKTNIELHWFHILLDLCMLKGFLLRRIEESNELDVFLPLSMINTMNVTITTLRLYFALIERLLIHFKSSWWNQLSSTFYESESNVIMDHVERMNALTTLQTQLEQQQKESNHSMQIAENEYKIVKQAGMTLKGDIERSLAVVLQGSGNIIQIVV